MNNKILMQLIYFSEEMRAPGDQTMQRGGDMKEGSIVEQLLADVRSGFTNRQYGESSFSVTKVQKVQLDATDSSNVNDNESEPPNADALLGKFVRGGYARASTKRRSRRPSSQLGQTYVDNADSESTCSSLEDADSVTQKRTRKSYTEDDNLIDILMASGEDMSDKMEGNFERVGSLKRRRQERRDKRSILDSTVFDRERAASPSPRLNPENSDKNTGSIIRTKSLYTSRDRPKSDIFDDMVGRTRRSRITTDRPSIERSNSVTPPPDEHSLAKNRTRLYRSFREKSRNSDRTLRREGLDLSGDNSEKNFPEIVSEKTVSGDPTVDMQSPRSRWRAGISCSSPEPHSLQTIDEKSRLETPTRELVEKQDFNDINSNIVEPLDENPKDRLTKRISRTSIDHTELSKMLNSVSDIENENTADSKSHRVSVSVRSKLNRRWHSDLGKSDIDQVLKAIEDSGKPIEIAGVPQNVQTTGTRDIPPTIGQESDINSNIDNKQITDNETLGVGSEEALKERRTKRKQRSHLDMKDVHKALVQVKSEESEINPTENTLEGAPSQTAKSPVSHRRTKSQSEESPQHSTGSGRKETKELSKAAKLAAKRRFRAGRFGDKETSTQKALLDHASGRWKSNVEKDEVDRALKDMASKGSMSRSKSYDESVAREAMGENGELSLAGRNSGSNPDTHSEVRAILRNSTSKRSSDPRRYGTYIPSDDSENELPSSSRRPSSGSKSDSPKSSSRLSIKSTNTSTETLRDELPSESESSPEQKRKNLETDGGTLAGFPKTDSCTSPVAPPRNKKSTSNNGVSNNSLEPKVVYDETDDTPAAMLAKWRMKRGKQRRSQYDNVTDNDSSLSPRAKMHSESYRYDVPPSPQQPDHAFNPAMTIIHKSEGSGEMKNDIGSRCSYASSSDSTRDEGFDSMSGTVSQRTSMSSTLESELTPKLSRKMLESMKPHSEKVTSIQDIIPPRQEIIVAHGQSVKELRKQRTESWTEYTVLANAVNKDTSLDSSVEYASTTPDSGHETMKDEWIGTPSIDSPKSPIVEVTKHTDNDDEHPKIPDGSPKKKKASIPSYMRGTTSSSKHRLPNESEEGRRRSASTNTLPTHVAKARVSRSGITTRASSNTSLLSATSSMSDVNDRASFSKSPSKRMSGSSTPRSRPTTPLSRPTTPMSSSRTSTSIHPSPSPTPTKGLTRTQSLRVSNSTRPSFGSASDQKTKKAAPPRPSSLTSPPTPSSTRSSTRRSHFMDATSSSSSRTRPETSSPTPPMPPPRTSSQSVRSPRVPGGRSRDDLIIDKSNPSPLTRHSSLRLSSTAAARITGREPPVEKSQSDSKVKSFMNRLGGSKTPEKTNKRDSVGAKLAPVAETIDSDVEKSKDDNHISEKDKSHSFLKRMVNKTKEKTPQRKSTDVGKSESPKKKITK